MVVEIPPRAWDAMRIVGGRRGRKTSSWDDPERVGEWTPVAEVGGQSGRFFDPGSRFIHLLLFRCIEHFGDR
jgi:hypothetical protein